MSHITFDMTIGDMVRASPAWFRVFENLGIDYCCGGKKSLATACLSRGLDPSTVVAMLSAFDGLAEATQVDPDAMTLTHLCNHIGQVHHEYLRNELPRLDFITLKVAAVHGGDERRLYEIRDGFKSFAADVAAHTQEEDELLFPVIRELEATGESPMSAALKASLEKLELEHDRAGAALARFKILTDGYTPPEWACNTFRALYDGLANLEKDMHQHVHKENNVLFPKALAML